MNANPIHGMPITTRTLPVMDFHVILVLGGDAHAEMCVKVKEFCEERAIPFSARGFNSAKYEHDALLISSLPCFYLAKRKSTLPYMTLYPNTVLEGLKTECLRCKSEQEEVERKAKERREAWNRTFQWMRNFGKVKHPAQAPKS